MLATDGENVIILVDDLFSSPSSAMYEAKLILCGRIPGRSGWGDGGREHNTTQYTPPLYPCAAVVGKTNFPSHYEECVAFIGQMLSEERMHVNMLTLAIEYRIFAAQGVNIQLSKKAKSSEVCWEISPRKKSDYSRNKTGPIVYGWELLFVCYTWNGDAGKQFGWFSFPELAAVGGAGLCI